MTVIYTTQVDIKEKQLSLNKDYTVLSDSEARVLE